MLPTDGDSEIAETVDHERRVARAKRAADVRRTVGQRRENQCPICL
jgi:hypothetical protein